MQRSSIGNCFVDYSLRSQLEQYLASRGRTKRRRNQTISALEKAASALENLEKSFEDTLWARKFRRNQEMALRKTNSLDLSLPTDEGEHPFVPPPLALIRTLRMYARVLKGFDDVATRTSIHSPEAFGRYLISEFVKTTTGEYHDKEVSALIGCALGETYDETAHCVWRSRNYKHIQAVSFPTELLIALGVLLANEA